MNRYAVTVPAKRSQPYKVRAPNRLEAVLRVLDRLGLRYLHTSFEVREDS